MVIVSLMALASRFCQRHVRVQRSTTKNQANVAKISNPGKPLVRRRGFVSSAGKLANYRLDESTATGPQPKCDRLA